MKIVIATIVVAATAVSTVSGFSAAIQPKTTAVSCSSSSSSTRLAMSPYSRRDAIKKAMIGTAAIIIVAGSEDGDDFDRVANAFSQQLDDFAYEPQQQATDGKWDLNSVFIGDYKFLPGMYPHAAGKLASNGPYEKVSDIYKIPGLTASDKELFKKYEKYFTVNPPGRSFYERINSRVST